MATIKVACPKCGQKVSGDESFYGTVVECPICSSDVLFPGQKRSGATRGTLYPIPPVPGRQGPAPAPPEAASPDTHPDSVIRSGHAEETFPEIYGEGPGGDPASPAPHLRETPAGEENGRHLPSSPIFGAISIVSAVLGVVSCVGGILFAPLAIIFGHTALARARHSPVQPAPGHTLGAIGLMIGYVNLVLLILVLLAMTFFGGAIKGALEPLWQSAFPR